MGVTNFVLLKKYMNERFRRIERALGTPIYGVAWDKSSDPTLTRTDDSVGMVANVGLEDQVTQNDFDYAPIFGEMREVVDTLGNVFIRIPKFYIRKTDGPGFKTWQVSKIKYPGFYLPWCFWDFAGSKELPYIDVGKYKASLGADNKLESKADTHPLIDTNIVDFRTYAQNNNVDGLLGYQQLDIHVVDVLRTLMFVEFATLDMQTVMYGFANGRPEFGDPDRTVAAQWSDSLIIVANDTGANYRVGQSIACVSSNGAVQRFYGRTITAIDVDTPEDGQTSIWYSGERALTSAIDDKVYNTGWKNGFSRDILASSGGIGSLSDGKYPCMYRGIESPYGDVWQWVDGLNINTYQGWVAKNAEDYTSDLFESPYEQLGYVNVNGNGYVSQMGWDTARPYAELPVGASDELIGYYSDRYIRSVGQNVARWGGAWNTGTEAGPSSWDLSSISSRTNVLFGGRLVRKALSGD